MRTKQNGKIEFSDTSMGSNEIIKVKETNESVIMKIERNPRSFPSLFKTLALFLFFFKYPKKIQETKSLLIYFLSLPLYLFYPAFFLSAYAIGEDLYSLEKVISGFNRVTGTCWV